MPDMTKSQKTQHQITTVSINKVGLSFKCEIFSENVSKTKLAYSLLLF